MDRTIDSFWLRCGAVLAGTAVALGAFGAHALEGRVTPERLEVWRTAVQYQSIHALAMIACALAALRLNTKRMAWSCQLFSMGVLLFSGSLYLLVLLDKPILGAITPFGGVSFLIGWTLFATASTKKVSS